MADDLQDANELIEKLEEMAIRTSQGSYLKLEDVTGLIEKKKEAAKIVEALPIAKTLEQARARAKKFLREQGFGAPEPREPGRSLSANEPQSPSRA
jgi:hypothetical protein